MELIAAITTLERQVKKVVFRVLYLGIDVNIVIAASVKIRRHSVSALSLSNPGTV